MAVAAVLLAVVVLRPADEPVLQPPPLSAPTTITVSDRNNKLYLAEGKDYRINLPPRPLRSVGGLLIVGGRNVVLIGGEISRETPIAPSEPVSNAYGLYLKEQTGTVHLEGLWIHGRGIGQALVLDESRGATIQVQSSRFEALHPVGHVHTDGIQSFRGPNRLLLTNVTIRTAGVGIQTMPHQFGPVALGTWEFRRVNVQQTTPDAYALWKAAHAGGWWREIHENFWVDNRGYLAWPDESYWNPAGPARVEGQRFRIGVPRDGDFVPIGAVGVGYSAPD